MRFWEIVKYPFDNPFEVQSTLGLKSSTKCNFPVLLDVLDNKLLIISINSTHHHLLRVLDTAQTGREGGGQKGVQLRAR